jgi:cell wall-associated NlpC family hydrolase
VWGGVDPDGYDGSGLTSTSWAAAGVSQTRTSRQQYVQTRKISYSDLRPGDLIFWGSDISDPQSLYHMAMFIRNGQIVEASRPGVPARITSMRWAGTMAYAGRP